MKQPFKNLFIALLLPGLMFASNDPHKGRHTKEKKYNQQFEVNADAELSIDNSYGNLDIITWDQNRIEIEVTVTVNGDNLKKVEQKLNEIDVTFEGSSNFVKAKTHFNRSRSWFNLNSSNVNIKVNYKVKMPLSNSVDLSNDYGAINLNRLEGRAHISCDYGKVTIGELLAENNSLNFDYTHHSTIGYMKSGKINADYSDFVLDKIETLELNADYTDSEINTVKTINYNCDYGKVIINHGGYIKGNGDYITQRIGSVHGNLTLKSDYGSIKIGRLTKGAKQVNINSEYASINIGYDANYNFDFKIELKYANLKGDNDFTKENTRIENSSKFYSGYRGSKNSGNYIRINSEYGSVKFEKQ